MLSTVRMIDVKRYINIRIDIPRYTVNCLIVAVQAIFVSFSNYGVLASLGCIGLFYYINHNSFQEIYSIVTRKIRNICKR